MKGTTMEALSDQCGYDESIFISDTPDQFLCIICTLVLRDPVQILSCGHKFCAVCFERYKTSSQNNNNVLLCPIDRVAVDLADVREDIAMARWIGNLRVRCHEHDRGCQWTGDLRDYESHKNNCRVGTQTDGDHILVSADGLRKLTDRMDRLESCLLLDNCKMASVKDLVQAQEQVEGEILTSKRQHQQDMDNMKQKNGQLEKDIEQLTKKYSEINKQLQRQQQQHQKQQEQHQKQQQVLQLQLDVYKDDFKAERESREKTQTMLEEERTKLAQLQLENQCLNMELQKKTNPQVNMLQMAEIRQQQQQLQRYQAQREEQLQQQQQQQHVQQQHQQPQQQQGAGNWQVSGRGGEYLGAQVHKQGERGGWGGGGNVHGGHSMEEDEQRKCPRCQAVLPDLDRLQIHVMECLDK